MTKKSDALANAVAEISSKFLPVDSFIYYRNPVLMLRGFSFDMPPGGCYIWKFYIPLFSEVHFLNMSLGYRIPNGYIETKNKDIKQLASEAIVIIGENDDFSENESLEEIISFSRNRMVSPIERSNLFKELECFNNENLEIILKRAAINRERLGIAG